MERHIVLSTKKLSPSLIEEAAKNGIEITEQEFISIQPIITKEKAEEIMPVVLETKDQFVTFTSANAVEAIKKYLHQGATWIIPNWKIFCLSEKTKEALKPNIKEAQIIATAENAKGLAQKIIENKIGEVIFFCGNKRRDELPQLLKEAGIKVHEIVVYETVETPVIATDHFDAVLFFSPSAAQSFFSVNQLKEDAVCFAIGETTAAAITDFTDNKLIISEGTSAEMMLASVQFYFTNKGGYQPLAP